MKLFYENCEKCYACKQIEKEVSENCFSGLCFLHLCYPVESLLTCMQDLVTEEECKCWRWGSLFQHECWQSLIWWWWGVDDCCWGLITICRSVSSVFHHCVKLQWLQNHPVFLLQWKPSAGGHRRDDIVNWGKIQRGMLCLSPVMNSCLDWHSQTCEMRRLEHRIAMESGERGKLGVTRSKIAFSLGLVGWFC